jgi:lipid-binding SYLF domain-containing protein
MNSRNTARATKYLLALSAAALIFSSLSWAADDKDQTDIVKRIDTSANVLNEIMATPDKAIPDSIMNNAKCIAVIPSMIKIAVGFGGNHGKGVATCRTIDLVMVGTNDQGMQHLLSSKFKLGAGASAAAGPVGRDATADTDVKMRAEVLTYSRTRGLFAGIDLSGAVINQDKDETAILFGKMVSFEDILNGKVPAPTGSAPFLTAVRKYSVQAKDQASN